MCTAVLIGRDPAIPPHRDSYTRSLLVSKDRRHLFVTPRGILSIIWSQDEGADQDVSCEALPGPLETTLQCKQLDRKDMSSLVASRDRVNINVADPSIILSDPVRGAVILTYGFKSGSRMPIGCLNNGPIEKFCLQKP
jgi:hypothetical protein